VPKGFHALYGEMVNKERKKEKSGKEVRRLKKLDIDMRKIGMPG